jgi:Zn-dependent protease with chaperone function
VIYLALYLAIGAVALGRSGTDPREYPGEAALIAFGWLPLLAWFVWMLARGRA